MWHLRGRLKGDVEHWHEKMDRVHKKQLVHRSSLNNALEAMVLAIVVLKRVRQTGHSVMPNLS